MKIDKNKLRNLIGSGKTERAIKELLVVTAKVDEATHSQVTNLQGQYNKLRSEEIAGILSTDESGRRYAKINKSLLTIIVVLPDNYPNEPKKDSPKPTTGNGTPPPPTPPQNRQSNYSQPLDPTNYVLLFILLLFMLVGMYAFFSQDGLNGTEKYLLLVLLGLIVGVGTHGVMNSRSNVESKVLRLGGPIVACLLIVFGGYYFLDDPDNDTSIISNKDNSITVDSSTNNENVKDETVLDTEQVSTSPVSQPEKQESIKKPKTENTNKTKYKKDELPIEQSSQNSIETSTSTGNVSQVPIPNPNQNTFESTTATQTYPNNTSTITDITPTSTNTTTTVKSPVTDLSKIEEIHTSTTQESPLAPATTLYSHQPFIIESTDVVIRGLKINDEIYEGYNNDGDYRIKIIDGLAVDKNKYKIELLNRHNASVAKCYIKIKENSKGIIMSSHNTCDTL